MSQQLVKLAEDLNLPALFCEQLQAGERITMWSEELELVKPRVWGVYQDVPGKFSLQIKFQGYTGSEAEEFCLKALPEDIAAAKAAPDPNYWELQGYAAVMEADLEPDVLAAFQKLLAWTQQAAEDKKNGVAVDYKQCPNLFFKPLNEESGLQLLPKVNKQGELSFSGWAFKALEWRGTGIGGGGEIYEVNEYFLNGRKSRANSAPITPPVVTPPVITPPSVTPPRRGRGGSEPPAVDPNLLATLV